MFLTQQKSNMAELVKNPQIFRDETNFILGDQKGDLEINNEPSETIPDQSFTIREIMEKFTVGIDLGVSKMPQYPEIEAQFENELGYIPPEFDLTDVPVETLQESLINVKAEIKKRKAEKIEAEKKSESSEGENSAEMK